MENRVYKGSWWLQPTPDDVLMGELTVEPNGKMHLELYGSFSFKNIGSLLECKTENVIFGRCYAPQSKVVDITLFDCSVSFRYNVGSKYPITKYSCLYALVGIHTDSMVTPCFFEASVNYKELSYWCPPHLICKNISDRNILVSIDNSHENDCLASVPLDNGLILKLVQHYDYSATFTKTEISQKTIIKFDKNGMCVHDVLLNTIKFDWFMSLATLSPVEHKSITLFSKEKSQTFDNGEKFYHSIELITCLYRYDESIEVKFTDFLFNYNDVSSDFELMYQKFYSDDSIAQIWSNFVDCLEKKPLFTSNDFLVVAQAIDGFSIRFRKESGYLEQLNGLLEEFHNIRKVKLTKDDLIKARGSRDYFTHILKIEKKTKKNAIDGAELYYLTCKLRILLICCLMDYLGMDKNKINELMNKSDSRILK